MALPRVSILTVTLNRPSLIAACESVDRQTFGDWHHYVLGDGTAPADLRSDRRSTLGFTRALGAEEPGQNMPDGTPNPLQRWALNHLELGAYVCFLDDDNVYEPTFLEKMIEALDASPDVGVALCAATERRYGLNIDGYPVYGRCDNSAAMYRREVAKAIEFPRASMQKEVAQDVEFIGLCASKFGWTRVADKLMVFAASPNLPALRNRVKLMDSWQGPQHAYRTVLSGDPRAAIDALESYVTLDASDGWSLMALVESYVLAGDRRLASERAGAWLALLPRASDALRSHPWIRYQRFIAGRLVGDASDTSELLSESDHDSWEAVLFECAAGHAARALTRARTLIDRGLDERDRALARHHSLVLAAVDADCMGIATELAGIFGAAKR